MNHWVTTLILWFIITKYGNSHRIRCTYRNLTDEYFASLTTPAPVARSHSWDIASIRHSAKLWDLKNLSELSRLITDKEKISNKTVIYSTVRITTMESLNSILVHIIGVSIELLLPPSPLQVSLREALLKVPKTIEINQFVSDFPIVALQNRLWVHKEREPTPHLQVTCHDGGDVDGDVGGGGGGGRVTGDEAIWADVSDETAISQIHTLLPTITRLRIRRFSDKNILSSLVANSRVLRHLDLAGANPALGAVPQKWLQGAKTRLTYLDASRLGITSLPPGVFKNSALRWLSFSGNALRNINTGSLSELKTLWHLDLSKNLLVELKEAAFDSLKELRSLDLSYNGLSKPAMNAVAPVTSLVVLDASHNALGGAGSLTLPPSLRVLFLRSTGLDDRDLDSRNLTELRILNVAQNELVRLQPLPELQELNASSNQLEQLAVWPKIQSLDISNNPKLSNFCETLGAPELRVLMADGVENVYDSGFFVKDCKVSASLQTVSAGKMTGLFALAEGAFESLPPENKIALRVANNVNLKYVDENAFRNIRLQQLDLSNNALEGLSSDTASWSDLTSVNLQGNPWRCHCNLQWMLDELLPDLYRWTPELLDDLRCSSPPRLSQVRFVHWFNRSEGVFCNTMDRLLLRGARTAALQEIKLDVSSGAMGVIISCGVLAVVLVGLGICAHHRYVRRRRVRNRRL